MPTEKEVQEKLHELNRASLVSERQKRLEWFREHNVEVVLMETIYYVAPKGVSRTEFVRHMIDLNTALRSVREQLSWMKDHRLIVKMEKTEYGERYVYVGERKEEKKEEHNQVGKEKSAAQNTQIAKEEAEKKNISVSNKQDS